MTHAPRVRENVRMARRSERQRTRGAGKARPVVGPSPNPATNLIIADIALRSAGRLVRHAVERALLSTSHPTKTAEEILAGRSLGQMAVGTLLARVATGSVPGALVVGGGMLAKALYDRSKSRHRAREEGEEELAEQAKRA